MVRGISKIFAKPSALIAGVCLSGMFSSVINYTTPGFHSRLALMTLRSSLQNSKQLFDNCAPGIGHGRNFRTVQSIPLRLLLNLLLDMLPSPCDKGINVTVLGVHFLQVLARTLL